MDPVVPITHATTRLSNWAGNVEYRAERVYHPQSVEQVQEVVRRSRKLRALGSRHSFSRIADSTDTLISLRRMNRVVSLDPAARTVTVEAGATYGDLCCYLHASGFALHNLPSTPGISIAGACSTGTHGSGSANGNVATAAAAIEFVDAAGEVVTLSRDNGGAFPGAVVGLGALGVITKLTLNVQPAFDVAQVVYLHLPMSELRDGFDEIMASGYSVSLFTDWTRKSISQVWIKSRVGEAGWSEAAADFHGARLAAADVHPVDGQPADRCTPQMGVPGPWHERLPHFRIGQTPSVGSELHSEYFIPVEHAWAAIMAIGELREHMAPHLFISEIRTVAADDLWMSPCYQRACVAIHMTWKPEWDSVAALLPLIEQKLAPFTPVPHWAKLFTMPPAVLRSRYPKLADFEQLIRRYDPHGKFRNEFLDEILS
ncbi:MAG TPA: FAD-binding protein [Longimicrobium sp.]|jgi:xylitol oxidase|uniref:FAD-binding protein n=1 Tax=Longimicrobium sp. TaxID=2029185 RepID=UPI002EDAA3BA